MTDSINVTNCSMGCLYAEGPIDKCLCKCRGELHSLMVPKLQRATCTPAARVRCQDGTEAGECVCACRGVNHALFRTIDDYSSIKINHFQTA